MRAFFEMMRGRAVRAGARFAESRQGAIALLFALALIPLILLVGFAVDFRSLQTSRAELQNALDSGVLAAARTYQTNASLTEAARQAKANTAGSAMFNTNLEQAAARLQNLTIQLTYAATGDKVTGTAAAQAPLSFGPLAGVTKVALGAESEVVWGQKNLWVSLALDNTGSMTQKDSSGTTKISALITATNQLLTILKGVSSTPGDVQVSLVPFSKTIQVGTENVGASWLDWTDWEAPPPNSMPDKNTGPGSDCPYTTSKNKLKSPYGYYCVSSPANGAGKVSTIPNSGSYKGYICPGVDSGDYNAGRQNRYYNGCYTTSGSSGNYTHTWVPNNHNTWTGCVMDRKKNYDVNAVTASGGDTKYPTENSAGLCVPSKTLKLGYDWNALTSAVDSMTAAGSTNQTIGLQWAWAAQSPGYPLSAPTLPPNTTQFIILLSDGLNTQNRWNGNGSSQSTEVDDRMALACANAKQAGITIYAVFLDIAGTQGNSTVLEQCASSADKYYALTTSNSISTAFQEIGQKIAVMHVNR